MWRPRFCYQGNLCCIYCYCYVSRHAYVEGAANITFKKIPTQNYFSIRKKKKKKKEKEKISLLIVRVGVILNRNVVDSEIIFLTSQSFG